jgi:2-polyprenyl-6-methoxyphenol hydroxylase-like FAD-dependent oxidoreductase
VWYHPVEAADLAQLMTDDSGRHHASGIAPSQPQRNASVQEMLLKGAGASGAPVRRSDPACTDTFPPTDLGSESPRLVFGRVVIIGDAAFVARPHVAMGVPKGAGDAIALVLAVQHGGSNILSALDQFEAQTPAGRPRASSLAAGIWEATWIAQLKPRPSASARSNSGCSIR